MKNSFEEQTNNSALKCSISPTFLNTKKKSVKFRSMFLANNYIYIFLENSFFLKFDINGTLEKVEKLPRKMHSFPMFIDNNMIYIFPMIQLF